MVFFIYMIFSDLAWRLGLWAGFSGYNGHG